VRLEGLGSAIPRPFALVRAYGAAAFPLPCLAGNPSGEEVRDGSHADNRGRGNRGGTTPTALRLLRVGAGSAGPCTTLEAALDSHPARPSLYRRSCSSPLAAGGAKQPLYLLLESTHREAEYGRFVVRSGILRPALLALLQLLAAFQPLVIALDLDDSSCRAPSA
jgi:hypothetical protein